MTFKEYEYRVMQLEAAKGGKNIELVDTTETERNLIAEVLAKLLYKIMLIAIQFGIDLIQVADISLLQNKKMGARHDYRKAN